MAANKELWIVVGVLVILAAYMGAPIPIVSDFVGSTSAGPSGGGTDINVKVTDTDKACGSTTMTMDMAKKYSLGTSMSAENGTVFVNGKEKNTYDEGATFTVQGGDKLDVYYALDPAGTNYYAAHATGTVPCTGQTAAFMTSDILKAGKSGLQDPPHELYASSSAATVTEYNKDDNVKLTSTALAIGAGATKTAKIVIDWQFEEGYGVVDGNTLSCRFTDSQIDQANMIASIDGKPLAAAKYVPTNSIFALSASNESTKHWSFPAIDGKTETTTVLELKIKGDDNNQPTARTNVSCAIIDTDYFQTDAGTVAIGIEDSDDNSNVGRASEVLIHIPVS